MDSLPPLPEDTLRALINNPELPEKLAHAINQQIVHQPEISQNFHDPITIPITNNNINNINENVPLSNNFDHIHMFQSIPMNEIVENLEHEFFPNFFKATPSRNKFFYFFYFLIQ